MKIENGKIILEVKTCWHCQGKKEISTTDDCPLYGKRVNHLPTKRCPHCGATNKHSHHGINPHMIKCYTCKGSGLRRDDLYDTPSMEEWAAMVPHFQWSVLRGRRHSSTFTEAYLGSGALYGLIDYGRTTAIKDDETILAQVKKDSHPSQLIQWVNKKTLEVPPALVIELRPNGYSVLPDWSTKTESKPTHYEANL